MWSNGFINDIKTSSEIWVRAFNIDTKIAQKFVAKNVNKTLLEKDKFLETPQLIEVPSSPWLKNLKTEVSL